MTVRRVILGILVTAAVALVPVVARAGGGDQRLVLGFDLHFTGPTSTAGSFIASGAAKDAGSSTVQDLSLVPFGHQDRAHLSGTQTFTGAQGTIVTRFRGTAHDVSNPHQWATGHFRIVDATGQYAGLRGGGRFTIAVDATSNQLIGTEDGRVH